MLISAYRRREPITVSLMGADWAFKPNAAGDIVCNVTDKAAAAHLVKAIPEAYQPYEGEEPAASAPAAAAPAGEAPPKPEDASAIARRAQVLVGSSKLTEPVVQLGDQTVNVADLLDAAFKRSGKTKSQWNAQDQGDIDDAVEAEANAILLKQREDTDATNAAGAGTKWVIKNGETSLDLASLDDKALRLFAKSLGVTVNNGLKGDKIRTVIVNAINAAAGQE
ncbi:hypothetical protein D3C85_677730 [compost metagenome]